MGWWSCTVLGGDPALDAHDALCDIMKVNIDKESYNRGIVEEYMGEMYSQVMSDPSDRKIALQVLGVIILQVGASVSDEIKKSIIDAAITDDWANDKNEPHRHEREFYMQDLIDKIANYKPGQEMELKTARRSYNKWMR